MLANFSQIIGKPEVSGVTSFPFYWSQNQMTSINTYLVKSGKIGKKKRLHYVVAPSNKKE